MIHRIVTGHNRYPALKADWIPEYQAGFIVFKEKDYFDILKKLGEKKGKNLNFRSADNGYTIITEQTDANNVVDDNFLKAVTDVLDESRILKENQVFALNSQLVDGVEVVRFVTPVDPKYTYLLLNRVTTNRHWPTLLIA